MCGLSQGLRECAMPTCGQFRRYLLAGCPQSLETKQYPQRHNSCHDMPGATRFRETGNIAFRNLAKRICYNRALDPNFFLFLACQSRSRCWLPPPISEIFPWVMVPFDPIPKQGNSRLKPLPALAPKDGRWEPLPNSLRPSSPART